MIETEIGQIADPRERLLAFVREREAVRLRREVADEPRVHGPPWTQDPILASYRFCNVRREDDRVTRWIAQNWRNPHRNDLDLWFAMVVARFVNWPGTLDELGYPVPWRSRQFLLTMEDRKSRRLKNYGGAYMIRADSGSPGTPTAVYQEREVFSLLWSRRLELRPKPGGTLNSYHTLLGQFHGLGSFMAAQVVADLKYAEGCPLSRASDWATFAASGPGSRRGLNRVLGRPVKSPWAEDDWRLELGRLREWLAERFQIDGESLHGQDVNNAACEFDKMERVRLGEGRPRARFP